MSKNQKIITFGNFSSESSPVPRIKKVTPIGSQILVELLTSQEMLGTNMIVNDQSEVSSPPQAYIVEIGPSLPKEWNVKVGDRVLLQGSHIPVPKLNSDEARRRSIVEVHTIKAILEEESLIN